MLGEMTRASNIVADLALEKAAVRAAGTWMRRYGVDRATFERSIRRVVVDTYEYARALFVLERRRVLLHTRPTKGETLLRPMPDPEALDAWDGNHDGLEDATRVAATCPRCTNGVRGRCSRCEGTRSTPCRGCEGNGRVPGVRGMKNCPDCRGVGSKRCTNCPGAGTVCELCEGSSQLTVWLAIDREVRSEVAVGQPAMFMQPHSSVHWPQDFDAGRWPNPLREDSGLITADEAKVPAGLAPTPQSGERVVAARVQRFGRKAYTIEAETAFGLARIRVEGDGVTVNALRSDFSPFLGRLLAIGGMAVLGFLASWLLENLYDRRHPFFATYGHGPTVFWLGLLFGLGTVVCVAVGTLIPRARPRYALPPAFASTAACAIGVALVFLLSRPTPAHALAALEKGDFAEATAEADALRTWKKDLEGAGQVTDELYLRVASGTTSVSALGEIAKRSWRSSAKREQVVARLREAVKREAPAAELRRSATEIEAIAHACDGVDAELARGFHAKAAVFSAEHCASVVDAACVISNVARARALGGDRETLDKLESDTRDGVAARLKEQWRIVGTEAAPPKARFAALEAALVLSKQWTDLRGGPSSPTRADIEQMSVRLPKLIAEAKERADKARRAEEAAEAAKERATRVRCGDGSFSPSCRCGGSLRGCCSHHGGVAGCGE